MLAVCAALVLAAASAFGQTGTLSGAVRDANSGKPVIGANVSLVGAPHGAMTDLDGRFEIAGIEPGTYDVRVFYLGYETRTYSRIEIGLGKTITLEAELSPSSGGSSGGGPGTFEIEELRVTADRVLSTTTAVLSERMNAATIGDAISAEQISKSPDATSGDALKRVTGLSVVDNKYVFVRGVTDRYNATTLNGISVTSTDTEVDRKSFAFDLIPSSLLSNTVVVKTATPDLPGDFSGGLVQVNTLEFPTERVLRLEIGTSQNDLTTGEPARAPQGGSRDWLGKDDGSRSQDATRQKFDGTDLAQNLTNNWGLINITAPRNESYSLSYGDRFDFGQKDIGLLGALTYKSSSQTSEFTEITDPGSVATEVNGTSYRSDVIWGGLVNLNFKLADNHKFSLKNNFIRSAKSEVSESTGKPASADSLRNQTNEWNERTLYVGQLGGTHKIPFIGGDRLETVWSAFYSTTKAKEPDRKNVDYHPHAWIDTIWILAENHRTWSELDEESEGANLDLKYEIGRTKLKAGTTYSVRERGFSVEAWFTDRSFTDVPYSTLALLPPDEIFAPENYGFDEEGNLKFQFTPWTDLTGEYSAKHDLFAYYGMIDTPFAILGQRFRAVGGARVEHSDQKVYTTLAVADPTEDPETEARIDEVDVLPSLNLTYLVTDLMNLRLAYYRSVNRPEFREMSNIKYFDFQRLRNVKGQPGLKRAEIENYDIRLEFFPDIGDVIAASYFYKTLTNAVEEQLLANPDRFVQSWFNSEKGENYGYELEVRKSLGFLFWDYLSNLVVGANYTRVFSSVEYEDPPKSGSFSERPLQGQAPWMVNASLTFTEPRLGTTLSVLYNRFGRRLDGVGDARELDVYEESSDLIDIAVTQDIPGGAKLKFAVKNLTGEDDVFTWGSSTRLQERISIGTTYGLSLSYTF
jgi:outer membrane receptor protein involved in Fe transport